MTTLPEPASSLAYGATPIATETWDVSEFVRVVLEKLWLVVLFGVAGFFVTYGYLARQAPIYLATGSLQVQPPGETVSVRGMAGDEPNLSTVEELNTLVQSLQRPSFYLEVADDPVLQGDLSLFPAKADGSAYSDQEKIQAVAQSVRVALQRGTLLIVVSAMHPQPATAQRICSAVLNDFVKERMESRSGSQQETYRFLLSEADRLGQALAHEEREIQKYDLLGKYDDQIALQKVRLEELGQRYKEKYPAMVEARALLQALQNSFDAEMLRIIKADEENGLKPVVVVDSAVGVTDDLRAQMIGQYQVLKRDIDTQRAIFQSLTAQKNQSDVMRSAQAETAVKIADQPVLPEAPMAQNPVRILFAGTSLGVALGVALAFLLNAMDRSIRTVDQAEAVLDLPVLSAVPEIVRKRKDLAKSGSSGRKADELPILNDGNSPSAEAIRSLRAAMSLMGSEEERRTLIFTSALPGEGKSFTAANYALSLAQQGLRTLLVDADLRRPSVHVIFGADRQKIGLVDYFLVQKPLLEFAHPTSEPRLDLLPSGTRAPNPAELLSGHGFARLIEEACTHYDRVVVDTAPVNAVSDTLTLLKSIQSVCLVVRAASSPREAVLRALRVLDKSGKRPVGILFNRVPRRADLGYHRTYYYHYGPAERYGESYGPAST